MPGFNNDINELPPMRDPDPREIEMREQLIAFVRAEEQRILDKHNAERDGLWLRAIREAVPECPTCGGPVNVSDSENPYSKDIHQMSLWCLTASHCEDSLQPLNFADCQQAGILSAFQRLAKGEAS